MLILTLLAACEPDTNLNSDTDTVDEDSGWDNYGDTNDTEDTDDTDSGTGDTDTGPKPEEWTSCQASMSNTTPAYPVFPAWDGRPYVNFTVSLTGATREWATLSWGSANSAEGWYISCADIIDGSTAVIRVEANSTYGASTFGNTDPGDGSSMDQNGYYWYPWSVTRGDLGGTPYTKMVDGEVVNLVEVEQVPQ